MAGPGGGPSRRSHTKSRKGCKTCKRRHIRCDETFPQCRNCTKHQVRCDYMDNPTAGDDSLRLSIQANLLWTSEIEQTVDHWRQTGQFPFPELNIYPPLQCKNLSKTELRFLYHFCSILNDVQTSRTSKLTLWTDLMPKFLSIAASHHFVMHAVYAFAANHLAWMTQSSETRAMAFHHAGIALKGLHEAIGVFSKTNADAVLSASLLLTWQSSEWRQWASLMTGTKTVINAMQAYRSESIFADYLAQQSLTPLETFSNESGFQITPEIRQEHFGIIQAVQTALQRLQPYLSSHESELKCIEQLGDYVERLRTSGPAQTPEEQFSRLYQLRKLLLWVPVALLTSRKSDINTVVTLGHFYGVAVSLEAMFPDIGAPFLANLALTPLEESVSIVQTCQVTQRFNTMTQTAAMLMDFPREALSRYRTRREWTLQQISIQQPQAAQYGLESLNIDLGNHIAEQHAYTPSLSPGFASSILHLGSPPTPSMASLPSSATPRSPFLEVPFSGVESYAYSSYPASSTSYHTSPAYTTTPLASPAFKTEDETSQTFQLTLPEYGVTMTSTTSGGGGGGGGGSVLGEMASGSGGGIYGGFTAMPTTGGAFSGGCVVPTAVWT